MRGNDNQSGSAPPCFAIFSSPTLGAFLTPSHRRAESNNPIAFHRNPRFDQLFLPYSLPCLPRQKKGCLVRPPSSWELALLYRHRRGRKTETSSDAPQEAPERARKDTPKEANCISRAASLLCVFTSVVSQAFLRRVPCPQGLGYCSSPPCAGNLFRLNDLDLRPSRLDGSILYHKIRSAAENAARTDSPPQTYPGSLCRTLLVSILIYGGNRKI